MSYIIGRSKSTTSDALEYLCGGNRKWHRIAERALHNVA